MFPAVMKFYLLIGYINYTDEPIDVRKKAGKKLKLNTDFITKPKEKVRKYE